MASKGPGSPKAANRAQAGLALAEALESISTGLPNVSLTGQGLGHDAAKEIARALGTNGSVRLLELDSNAIGDAGAAHLAQVLQKNMDLKLKMLDLTSNGIGDKGANQLAEALEKNVTLEQLDLSSNRIKDSGVSRFATSLRSNRTLRSISLNSNKVGSKGCKQIAEALQVNRTLKILGLRDNAIGDNGGSTIAKALAVPGSALNELSAGGNRIGDNGVVEFALMLKCNQTLKELQLDRNCFGDRGGCALAEAIECNSTLQTLWVVKNPLGGEAVARFAKALEKNNGLRRLGISSTSSVKPEVAKAMEQARRARLAREGKLPTKKTGLPKVPGQHVGSTESQPAPEEAAKNEPPPEVPPQQEEPDDMPELEDEGSGANTVPRTARVSCTGATGRQKPPSSASRLAQDKIEEESEEEISEFAGDDSDKEGDVPLDPPPPALLAEIQLLDEQLLFMDMDSAGDGRLNQSFKIDINWDDD